MYYRLLRNDILKSKAITLTTMLFVAAAAMLVALAAILIVNLAGAIDTMMTQGKTPYFMQMHAGEVDLARLAANAPDLVLGVVLEDPPLFTTLLPRAQKTWNYVDLAASAHAFLASGEEDFVAYNVTHGKFFTLFGDLQPVITQSALAYRAKHPHEPVKIFYMPPVMNEIFRGLHGYDPRFGQAFYDGSWDDGFDHADALTHINVPAALIHTNWSYDADGILMAAMDDQDAERARSLIKDVQFFRVDSGHGFHFEKPRDFIQIMVNFKERIGHDLAHE